MSQLEQSLHDISDMLFEKMDELLPEPGEGQGGRLYEAMRYSVLSEGKRLRPFLTVTSANLFGVSEESSLQTAAAIEFIHAYSLIHDDLPAMDDDDMRRGQPSCHKKFDEATAILAGDALLTYAFEVLADESTHHSNSVRAELVRSVARAVGPRGMVGGQMLDLKSDDGNISIPEIIHLQRMKTGALFAVSCEAGAILGKAARNLRNALRGYAHDLGLSFQITDDLLDAEGVAGDTLDEMGRMDKSSDKATLVGVMGVDKAREQAKMLANQAVSHLVVFGDNPNVRLLKELAEFVIDRQQ